jgi:DNA-binding NarL/FixJ family response regulator
MPSADIRDPEVKWHGTDGWASSHAITRARRAAAGWRSWLSSARVAPNGPELIAPAAAAAVSEPDPRPRGRPRLTRRELEIVRLVALGATNRDIASRLYLSPETVRSHIRNAMGKVNARTRAQLVAIALSERLLEDTD